MGEVVSKESFVSDFDNAQVVESITYQMKLADYPRGLNRAKINDLLNGLPPYTDEEARDNQIEFNVNPLGGTTLCHDGRSQMTNAFTKPGRFFTASTDYGPTHKRDEYGTIVTREANRIMKRSLPYYETMRSKFAQLISHGISPCAWEDKHHWAPDACGVEDVFIPANTRLTMKNLPFFAVYRQYTGAQLKRMISGPKVDPGWNLTLANSMIEWVDKESSKLSGTIWPEVWSPEKMSERIKGDGGLYASDAVTTIDCYDFYFYQFDKKNSGWYRRIILDAYGQPGVGPQGSVIKPARKSNYPEDKENGFLYTSKNRKYADRLSEIIGWQFADLSAVAPFQYHSVRSLGFLIWAVCHLQNRLYCKIQEATFESLLQYFRVKNKDDAERALTIELIKHGLIDESVEMVPQAERWQTNMALAEFAYGTNDQIISKNSSSFVQKQEFTQGQERKTKFQVGAELNAATSLVSAGLMQAYKYQQFEYRENLRRLMRQNSRDSDVREFRNNCLKNGVPEQYLVIEAWDISTEQVMGAGNKTLELAIAKELLNIKNQFDPGPQRTILRNVTLALTDNAALTNELVPEEPTTSYATEDAQRAAASLLAALPMEFKEGVAHDEYAGALLNSMQVEISKIQSFQKNMATQEQIVGLVTIAGQDFAGQPMGKNGIFQHISKLEQDPEETQKVKQLSDALGNMLNEVKGFQQRLAQQQQKQAQNGNGVDAETQAKLQSQVILAQAKAQNMRESHGLKTAQRQVAFDEKQKQDTQKHQMEMQRQVQEMKLEAAAKDLQTASAIRTNRMKAFDA